MKLKSLDIPNDLSQLGSWVDDQLVSTELLDTVMELEILVGERRTRGHKLSDILSDFVPEIHARGVSAASPSAIRQLLRQPTLLLELQESVLLDGGDFWQQKFDQNYHSPTALKRLLDTLDSNQRGQVDVAAISAWSRKRIAGVTATISALVLFALMVYPNGLRERGIANSGKHSQSNKLGTSGHSEESSSTSVGATQSNTKWGFSASGLLNSPLAEAEMLELLSKASLAWYNKVPRNAEQLEVRLRQFDLGCREVLAADLPQLSVQKRDAVHQACADCRVSIANLLTELTKGTDIDVALIKADATIELLGEAIESLKG